jgi:hypothetical protein
MSTFGFHSDIKEAISERLAIKDEISRSSSYNRGSLSKISQGFRDIADLIISKEHGNISVDDFATLQRMKEETDLQIRLYDLEMKKLYRMACTTEAEISYYQQLSESLTQSIDEAKNSLKEDEERRERELIKSKNLQEYEALAKLCLELPSRKQTMGKIEMIQKEINDMEKQEMELLNDFTVREQKIKIFIESFMELKSGLDDDVVMEDAPT